MRIPSAVVCVLLGIGCGSKSSQPAGDAGKTAAPAAAPATAEALLTKDDVLSILSRNGLEPRTAPAPDVSRKMAEALAGIPDPADRFLLGIDNEGLMAFEFKSVADARLMESRHQGEGFRHHNWYFGGLVSAEVYNKTKAALEKG